MLIVLLLLVVILKLVLLVDLVVSNDLVMLKGQRKNLLFLLLLNVDRW